MNKRKKNKRLIFYLVGLILVLLIFAIIGKSKGWIGSKPEIQVDLAEVQLRDIVETVSASGTIQPEIEVKLSPDVPGEIIELYVEEGDSVVQGELLIKIRPDNFQSALERTQANLNQQKANLANARARLASAEAQFIRSELEYNRTKQLKKDNVISDSDFEVAEANFKVAQSDLEAAKRNVEAARYVVESSQAGVNEALENLRLTSVHAPVNGTVSKLSVEKGERVVGTQQMEGTEMLRIADLTKMEVRVDVNENDIIRVALGDTASIEVDSYSNMDQTFKGVVTQISNSANPKNSPDAVTEFEVRIRILNDSYQDLVKERNIRTPFRPGMTASVDIITDKKRQVTAVPLASVTTRNPNASSEEEEEEDVDEEEKDAKPVVEGEEEEVVFVFEDGKAQMVLVETGISDFNYIEITSGLDIGQKVISGPFSVVSKRLKEGDAVKSRDDNKTASR
jgi:HlyD family secretion protein